MVSKKLLGLAVAAAFSSQAFAVINLNDKDAPGSTVTFAKEALLTSATVTGNDNGTYYTVAHTGAGAANTVLNLQMEYGTGIANTQKRFLRLDLTNAIFTTNSALASTSANAAGVLVQGGQNKDTYAILEVTASGAVPQGEVVTVNVDELGINANASVGIKGTVYETLTAAVNQTANTALNTKELASTIKTASGVKVTATPSTVTADVVEGFKKFTVADVLYKNLGTLAVAAEASILDRDTTAVALTDMIDAANSKVKLMGDFSVGAFNLAAAPASAANCTAGDDLVLNAAKTQSTQIAGPADITLATFAATETLCVVVPGDKLIPKGTFTGEITFAKATDSAFPLSAQTVQLGTVAHNGTTIQVPYVTTFDDYAQRIVMVNRGGSDAGYSITFTPEAGVTATAGAKATGTIPAGKTLIIPAKEVVTLSGATRTAATINIVAVSGNIDAATTQVNLSDKSTDTVKLQ